MKNMLLLIDFSPMSNLVIKQALILAKLNYNKIIFCHVSNSNAENKINEINESFKPFLDKASDAGVPYQTYIPSGNLNEGVKTTVAKFNADIILAGTHGKQGILQHLFGSKIFNLVQEVNSPFLVLNKESKVVEEGFKNVLVPVSHHTTYLKMLEKTTQLLAINGKIIIFAIVKYGLLLDREVKINVKTAQQFLNSKGIENEYLEIVSDQYTKGYSQETLKYIKDQEIDLITIFTKVSDKKASFALTDKENIILNDIGITVLCVDC
jgi:nucleotide-binding universal stress UspA family protein